MNLNLVFKENIIEPLSAYMQYKFGLKKNQLYFFFISFPFDSYWPPPFCGATVAVLLTPQFYYSHRSRRRRRHCRNGSGNSGAQLQLRGVHTEQSEEHGLGVCTDALVHGQVDDRLEACRQRN